jgi:hypothetical protein
MESPCVYRIKLSTIKYFLAVLSRKYAKFKHKLDLGSRCMGPCRAYQFSEMRP